MQASAACPSCSGRLPVAHIDDIRPICRRMRASTLFGSRNRLPDITAAAADRRLGRTSFASTTLAETWTAPANTLRRKDAQPRRKAQQPQQHHQQPIRSRAQHTPINSSSSSRQPHSPASNPQEATAAKYGPNYTLNRSNFKPQDSQACSSSQQLNEPQPSEPNQLLSSAIDKLYKQRLREVKTLVSSGLLEELQRDLTPEQQQSLQLVLQDLQDIQGSWEEEEEQLNPAEQQLVDHLANTQIMPDDFGSYLMAMLPEGSGPAELQQLMHSLDPAVLQDIQSVYTDLKEFEQSQLDLPEAQQRYVELSSRIAGVTTRVQRTLTAKMQQQPQQQQQQQQQPQQQRQRQRAPLLYSEIASTSVPAEPQQQQQQQQRRREPLRFSTIAFGSSSTQQQQQQQQQQQSQPQPQTAGSSSRPRSSSSSSSTSSSGWGSSWAKTRPAFHPGPLVASQSKGALFGQQQQQQQQELQQQQQVRVSQPAQLNAAQQQQQQQQGTGCDVRQAGRSKQQQQREVSQANVAMEAAALSIPNVDVPQQQQQQQQQQQPPPVRQRRRRVIIRRESSPTQQ